MYWWRPLQGKRAKMLQFEKARKSWFDTRELSQEFVMMVENFYEQDDISRQDPGKHYTIVVHTNVRKETHQRRDLFMTVAEV